MRYMDLARDLERRILEGEWRHGDAFVTVDRLRAQTGYARNTIVSGLKELARRGYIKRGKSTRHGYTVVGTATAPARDERRRDLRPVSVVLPFESWNYVAARLLKALEEACVRWDIRLVFQSNGNDIEREGALLRELASSGLDATRAVVLMTCQSIGHPHLDVLRDIQRRGTLVLLDRWIRGLDAHYVGAQNRSIGYRAARRLMDGGCESIAFAGGLTSIGTSYDRHVGCLTAVRDCGMRMSGANVARARRPQSLEEVKRVGREFAARLLDRATPPDGIVCGNDMVGAGVIEALRERKLKPGRDVLVTGCDNNRDLADASGVRFTTFEYPFEAIAGEIAFLLRRLRATPDLPTRQTEFAAAFVEGRTA